MVTGTVSNGNLAGPASPAAPRTPTMVSPGFECFSTHNPPTDAITEQLLQTLSGTNGSYLMLFNLETVNMTS